MNTRTQSTAIYKRVASQAILAFLLLFGTHSAWAEPQGDTRPELVAPTLGAVEATSSDAVSPPPPTSPDPEAEALRLKVEKARLEAEIAKAEAKKAQAEAEKAKAEAEMAKLNVSQDTSEEDATISEEPEEEPVGVHTHDGFFLRLTPGLGFGTFNASGTTDAPTYHPDVKDPEESGPTSAFGLSLGGAVTENLILHGDFWLWGTLFEDHDHYQRDFTSLSFSLGLTYYFMPVNVYLSADVGHSLTVLNMYDDGEHEYETMPGVSLGLSVGKEWWVSDNWGLGLAARGTYGYAKSDDLTVHQGGGMLLFSATFN